MLFRLIAYVCTRVRDLYLTAAAKEKVESENGTEEIKETEEEDDKILEERGYKIEGKLGEGSFSTVMKAYSKKHHRHVAIKIITRKNVPAVYMRKFLPREINLIKTLKHHNIIKLLNITETTRSIYVIMNMATNGSLLEVIRDNRFIDEKRACRWFHHLVEGIAYCHSKGVAHRDLKCENLLLDEQNILKITDFGFAREDLPHYIMKGEENTNRDIILSSTFCGSYAYACPEILMQKPYEPHLSDTWSMGIILYAMLFGRLPFDDKCYNSLVQQVLKPVRFPSRPCISFYGRNIILKILSPPKIRIYIPKIEKDEWYVGNYDSGNEEEYRKPYALKRPAVSKAEIDTYGDVPERKPSSLRTIP